MTPAPMTPAPVTPAAVDWPRWMERWDAQQTSYLPRREERFAVMIDAVEVACGPDPLVLDLAAGPGSLAQRLLARLPAARAVAVDVDPVLLAMGRSVLGDQGGRLAWAEADLRAPGWAGALPGARFDAVLSTTALHWLPPADLLRVCHDVAGLLRPGGLFLNGDHLGFAPSQPTLRRVVTGVRDLRHGRARLPAETWTQWWEAVAREPGVDALIERRVALAHEVWHGDVAPLEVLHAAALADAGFAEVAVLWSDLDDRVLAAVR